MVASRPVWYVAYGSNLRRSRFETYLRGGSLEGTDRTYPGCRNPLEPSADRAVVLRHRLTFGRRSPTWGGGVAFVDPARDRSAATVARAWRVEAGQLGDLIAQENGASRHDPDPTWFDLGVGDVADCPFGWYRRVVRCDDVVDEPAFTVTTHDWPVPPNPPAAAYLAHVRVGLVEVGLDHEAAEVYLAEHL